jgi:hypothetical protein
MGESALMGAMIVTISSNQCQLTKGIFVGIVKAVVLSSLNCSVD